MYLQLFCYSTGVYILILQVHSSTKVYTLNIMIKPRQKYFITYDIVLCVCNKRVGLLKSTHKK